MSRPIRLLSVCALAVLGVATFAMFPACSSNSSSTSSGTARMNVLVTDSPSDDWQQVTVMIKSISLRNQLTQSYADVWTADPSNPDSGKQNLVDLSGVATILGSATIPAGTYDRMKLTINTDPTTMTLIDDGGNTIDPANITVNDPSQKGEIKVDIAPPIMVADGGTANLQVDFDLAHPLSIVVINGKVVINLQIRHKAVPRNLRNIQFARNIGNVTSLDGTTGFSMKTLDGIDLTFGVNADTIYTDVDANQAGDFTGLTVGKGVLVASNMNSDGTLYARRVWYGDVTKLPQFTPEGLVRRVGDNWIKVFKKDTDTTADNRHSCHWDSDTIFVDANTVWTFQTDIPMGTGTAVLHSIRRGFRVDIVLVDANASPKVAQSINVNSARDEGGIKSVTTTGFSFGGWDYCNGWPTAVSNGMRTYSHTWLYSAVTDHLFSWWYYGLPSSGSTTIQDFMDTVNQANGAHLRVFGWAELYWDQTNSQWVAENLVLAPEKLPDPQQILTAYTTASGSMGVGTFDWDNWTQATVMTVVLDTTGDLQTVVGVLGWNSTTKILTFTVPVPPDQWEALLTPGLLGVRVWVRPVKATDGTFSWHAYSVLGFEMLN